MVSYRARRAGGESYKADVSASVGPRSARDPIRPGDSQSLWCMVQGIVSSPSVPAKAQMPALLYLGSAGKLWKQGVSIDATDGLG